MSMRGRRPDSVGPEILRLDGTVLLWEGPAGSGRPLIAVPFPALFMGPWVSVRARGHGLFSFFGRLEGVRRAPAKWGSGALF